MTVFVLIAPPAGLVKSAQSEHFTLKSDNGKSAAVEELFRSSTTVIPVLIPHCGRTQAVDRS